MLNPLSSLLVAAATIAAPVDPYRRHPIEVEHYRFAITLADSTDRLEGEAAVRVRVLRAGVRSVALDLANVTSARQGRGMQVSRVTSRGAALAFAHQADRLTITPERGQAPMTKVTPFLMFNDQLEAAMEFHTATFPDSEIRSVARTARDGPVSSAEFVVGGQVFMGYNGSEYSTFSEGFSLYVDCEDQAEVDEYWDKLVRAGAKPTACGWITDPLGLSAVPPATPACCLTDACPRLVQSGRRRD